MRLSRSLSIAAAAAGLVLGATACGDSVGPNTITLTNAEVQELFAQMSQALGGTGVTLDRTGATMPALAPTGTFATAENISLSADCPSGGSVGVSGSVNPSGTTGASFNLTETFNSCQTTNFTLGNSINFSGSITTSQTGFSFEEHVKGGLGVTRNSDGVSGNCAIDFTVNGSFSNSTTTLTASGTICGINANGIVTATA